MKLQLIIAASLLAFAIAQEPAAEQDPMVGEHVERAIKTTTDAIAATKKAIADEKKACTEEISESQKWMDSIDEKKLAAMRARRIRDKKNLLEAVKERITVMTDYLGKLKLARGKLSKVITHVNTIYGNAYDEAINAQKESARIMMLLGLSIGHTYNPGSEFSKIKLPREDSEDKDVEDKEPKEEECKDCQKEKADVEEDTKTSTETTLMELESEVHAQMSRCKGEFCEAAYHHAFDIYKSAHNNAKHDFEDFGADKKIIVFFRTTVSKLIKRKEGRLANLTKQADELEKSLAEAEGSDKGPLMKIIDMIADHKERITASCGVMKGRSLEMIAELEALSKCAKGEECSASDPKTQDVAPKADDASEMLKKEEAAASGAQGSATAAAAPAATGSAAPAATAAATAAPAPTGSSEQVFDESAPTQVQ